MNIKQTLGLIGSVILLIGEFAPFVSFASMFKVDATFIHESFSGPTVAILAVISFILVLVRKYNGLWLTGLGSLGVMAVTFIKIQLAMSTLQSSTPALFYLYTPTIRWRWGWIFLIVGAALLIASAAIKERVLPSPQPNEGAVSKLKVSANDSHQSITKNDLFDFKKTCCGCVLYAGQGRIFNKFICKQNGVTDSQTRCDQYQEEVVKKTM